MRSGARDESCCRVIDKAGIVDGVDHLHLELLAKVIHLGTGENMRRGAVGMIEQGVEHHYALHDTCISKGKCYLFLHRVCVAGENDSVFVDDYDIVLIEVIHYPYAIHPLLKHHFRGEHLFDIEVEEFATGGEK